MQCRSWKTGNYCCNNNLCCDDRKVEIQTFGIDADLDTNEISDTTGSGEEAIATTLPVPINQEEIGEESIVNTVIIPLDTTTIHNHQETTLEDEHEETTIPDPNKRIVIKEAITVNVSSFDLYPSEEISDVVEEIATKATINLQVDAESDETTLLASAVDPDYEIDSSEVTTVHTDDDTDNYSEEQSDEQNDSEEQEDEDYEDAIISQEEISTAASSAKSQDRVTHPATSNDIPRVTVDKFGRPKNRPSVHRFPVSGAVSVSGTLCIKTSAWSIIKSIVAMFIQFKLISNSLT